MYCNNCGNKAEERQVFCDRCGNKMGEGGMGNNHSHRIIVREKSTGAAALLSVLWPGLGQLYVGRVGRGLALMMSQLILIMAGAFFTVVGTLFGGLGGGIGSGIIFYIAIFALWAWNIFDAYKNANVYNDAMMQNGRRPW